MSLDITNFFKSKRRDLSNNSEEGGESSKKQREGSLNDSSVSNKTEVFAEGLKSPECVSILFKCLQNLEKGIKILRDIPQTMQENQIKGTTQLTDLQDSVNFIIEKFQEYEQDRREKEREIKELKENISTLSKRLDDLNFVIDRQEQYSRLSCLLFHGIEEESKENTDQHVIDVLNESVGETISIQDIDRTHRFPGKKPNGKSRPVIVKFVPYNTRNLIFKNKKSLKDQELV